MTLSFQGWMRAVWTSLIEPADVARSVMGMRLDAGFLWTAMTLIVVVNALFLGILPFIAPGPTALEDNGNVMSPFVLTVMIGVLLVLLVFTTHHVGRLMGGEGDFRAALTLMVWFYAVNLTLEAIQLILMVFSPFLSVMFGMIAIGGLVWCFVNFIDVLHGFKSLGKSFLALIFAVLGMGILGGILLSLLGVTPPPGGTI